MNKKHESAVVSYSSSESLKVRQEIFAQFESYPATDEEKERSMGLFLRGSLLARILAIHDIYQKIIDIPGVIMDIGTWRGQTAVLCENLRAIYEPMHLNRRIACFDTFEGYKGFSEKDKATDLHKDGTYGVGGDDYAALLERLLLLHEKSNVMGHNFGKHKVVKGDCRETIPQYFRDNSNEFVALAFFDVNAYEPSQKAFEDVWPRLAPGGIAAFWQLTRNTIPAEAMVYTDSILSHVPHTLHRCKTYPGLCYLIKQ
jgi:hypothetical protein